MSDARTVGGGVSQRARNPNKSKVVFKPVLDNPFSISWPEIPLNTQDALLAATVDLLSCLKEYYAEREARRRKVNRTSSKPSEPPKTLDNNMEVTLNISTKVGKEDSSSGPSPEPARASEAMEVDLSAPSILTCIKIGINEVGKLLERHIHALRHGLLHDGIAKGQGCSPSPVVVFACRWDINPPTLFAHIPHLVASANTLTSTYHANFPARETLPEIKLVNLPKGSESVLSTAMGIRRVSIVALNSNSSLGPRLEGLVKQVPRLATPWLIPTAVSAVLIPRLEPTHVKHLKTRAPVDSRAAKQERIEARKAAKRRRQLPPAIGGIVDQS